MKCYKLEVCLNCSVPTIDVEDGEFKHTFFLFNTPDSAGTRLLC